MNKRYIHNIKYWIIALAILFGASPFVTSYINASPNALLSFIQNEDDEEEDEEDGTEDDDEEDEEGEDDEEEEEDEDEDPVGLNEEEEIVVKAKDGHEEIIEVPEGLIYETDTLLQEYYAQQYLATDTNCTMSDVNPVFEDSVYLDRLKRMPTAMEMPWNEVVQKFIDRYSGRLRRSVSYMLGASNFYMPIFEQALEVYGIPLELKYLPVIESALNPNAVSRVGATGLWQFMIATGKRYGLRVNSMIDERRDPVKASYAAAHYLSDLYNIFGDWNLVIAAYNAGPGNINKAIQRSGGKRDYWEIYPYLPMETRGYVPAFIAANYIMNYYCEHNICPMITTLPVQSDTIMLYRNLHLEQVSQVLGIDIKELRALNPQYRRDVVTGYTEPTDLRLPQEYISKYIAMEDSIFNYNVDELMKRDVVAVNDAAPVIRKVTSTYSRRKANNSRRSKAGKRVVKKKKKKATSVRKKRPAVKKAAPKKKARKRRR